MARRNKARRDGDRKAGGAIVKPGSGISGPISPILLGKDRFVSLTRDSFFPSIDLNNHYRKSVKDFKRVPLASLRNFSTTVTATKAINKITNAVLSMPWSVLPPEEDIKSEAAWDLARDIKRAILRPNQEKTNTFRKLARATISDILTLGYGFIERHEGDETQPFWLWEVDSSYVHMNPNWHPSIRNVEARYYFGKGTDIESLSEIYDSEMFMLQHQVKTYEVVSPAPLEIAYHLIDAWLDLNDYQTRATSKAVRNSILQVVDATEDEIVAFRQYWNNEIEAEGETPIINKEVKVASLNAKNDEELYLKYEEKQMKLIALAFELSNRDFGLTDHDNRATAGAAADSSFQDAILPMALTLHEHLAWEVVDYYYPGFRHELTDTEPRSEGEEAETAGMLFEKGVITKNESRRRAGEEEIGPAGDRFADGSSLDGEPVAAPSTTKKEEEPMPLAAAGRKPTKISRKERQLIKAEQLSLF